MKKPEIQNLSKGANGVWRGEDPAAGVVAQKRFLNRGGRQYKYKFCFSPKLASICINRNFNGRKIYYS